MLLSTEPGKVQAFNHHVRNAGGAWQDSRVVVDGNLVTSRKPDDLPAFNAEFAKLVRG
jgi:protease I